MVDGDDIDKRLQELDAQRAEIERRRLEIESKLKENERRIQNITKRSTVQAEQLERISREFPIVSPIVPEEDDNQDSRKGV